MNRIRGFAKRFVEERIPGIVLTAIGIILILQEDPFVKFATVHSRLSEASAGMLIGLVRLFALSAGLLMALVGLSISHMMFIFKRTRWSLWLITPLIALLCANKAMTDARIHAYPDWGNTVPSVIRAYFYSLLVAVPVLMAYLWFCYFEKLYGRRKGFALGILPGLIVLLCAGIGWSFSVLVPLGIVLMWVGIWISHSLVGMKARRALIVGAVVLWSCTLIGAQVRFDTCPRVRMEEPTDLGVTSVTIINGGSWPIGKRIENHTFNGGGDYMQLQDLNAFELLLLIAPVWLGATMISFEREGAIRSWYLDRLKLQG